MEYIEGDTLARLLARAASTGRRLPTSVALRIAIDMLSGLNAAHDLRDDQNQPVQLVHRDVSPQNVLVGQDGIARITDFGVARAASRLTATRVGQLKGKIAYMAPEQAAGSEELDRRADVFSAGIVIWEALAQKRLFKAENEAATLSRVITDPVPLLSQISPQVSREVSDVVMRALERDREKRFPTCAAFADALEAAASDKEKVASPRELAAYVNEVIGEEIAQQRDNVRAWLAHSEPTGTASGSLPPGVIPSSSVSAAAMALPGLGEPSRTSVTGSLPAAVPPKRSRLPLALAAMLLVALLGMGGFMLTRSARSAGGVAASSPPVENKPAAPAAQTITPAPSEAVAPEPSPAAPSASALPAAPLTPAAPAPSVAPAVRAAPAPLFRPKKKKSADDVDLRNPYR
jgi:serine/threonine-protein kinase